MTYILLVVPWISFGITLCCANVMGDIFSILGESLRAIHIKININAVTKNTIQGIFPNFLLIFSWINGNIIIQDIIIIIPVTRFHKHNIHMNIISHHRYLRNFLLISSLDNHLSPAVFSSFSLFHSFSNHSPQNLHFFAWSWISSQQYGHFFICNICEGIKRLKLYLLDWLFLFVFLKNLN